MQIELSVAQAEDLINILASYDEYVLDKLDYVREYPDEYEEDVEANLNRLRRQSQTLYNIVVPHYSRAVAESIYGPEEGS